jgi:hypothetical protein
MDGAESDGSSTVYIPTVGGIVMEQQRAWLQRYRQYPMAKMLRPLRAVRPALRAAWTLSSAAWIPWLGTVCCVESITHPAWTPSTSPAGTLLDHHHPRSVDSILGRQSAGVFRIGRSPGGPLAGGRGEERGAHSRCERQARRQYGPVPDDQRFVLVLCLQQRPRLIIDSGSDRVHVRLPARAWQRLMVTSGISFLACHALPCVACSRPHSLACCCRRPALSVYYHHHPPSCPVVSCFVSSCPVDSSHFIQPSSSFLCASCLVHDLALALVSTLSVCPPPLPTYIPTHLVTTISPHLTSPVSHQHPRKPAVSPCSLASITSRPSAKARPAALPCASVH